MKVFAGFNAAAQFILAHFYFFESPECHGL
jgi:hypothetical protein